MTRTVPMSNCSAVALVDAEDHDLVSQYRWSAWAIGRTMYVAADVEGKRTYMHRLLAGVDGREVDHRNGNGLDNRRSNLRATTHRLNLANQQPQLGRSSRFKGVSFDRERDRWAAYIKVDGRKRSLGRFLNEEAAARAYDAAASEAWGEFARLNLPVAVPA